ncbi:ribonuclease H-like domain-containing protein [Candidatus Dojkabacteria bacterium]|jgi:DEAD/DEAH box helicase domain-containing protein|nr:ribonuclease H-like domain-containing protein [Candidatus Dojkabacteria bacterium]
MIFLDIETKNAAEDDYFDTKNLQISYIGVIDDKGNELDFWEQDIPTLGELLKKHDWVVGYNSISFDLPIIGNYLGAEINDLPQLDLMVALQKTIGFRPKLDDVVSATLGRGKLGKGTDAPKYWASGQLEELKTYCMEDVRLTKELYEFGLKNGYVKYYSKKGFVQETKINWDLGKKEKKIVEENLTLF